MYHDANLELVFLEDDPTRGYLALPSSVCCGYETSGYDISVAFSTTDENLAVIIATASDRSGR